MIRMTIMVAVILNFSIAAGYAEDKDRRLDCTGVMIEPTAMAQSSKSAQLNFDPQGRMTMDFGQGSLKTKTTSDNKIQLKFKTKDFVGELFHYSNDLFLIYPSGHLARLTCKAAS